MGLTLYLAGAGLTKSLERNQPAPLMMNFVHVLADYVNGDKNVVLNALVQMELGKVYRTDCPECLRLAREIDQKRTGADSATRDRFLALVRERPPESIEAIFERVESMSPDTIASAYASGLPDNFRYAINEVFATIGWNLNLDPLTGFLKKLFNEDDQRKHAFVSFNYDLTLDRAVELASERQWQPQGGYGFEFEFFAVDDSTALDTGPLPTCSSEIQIQKPHGSLNFLQRRPNQAKSYPGGALAAPQVVLPLTGDLELRHWPISNPWHSIDFRDFGAPNVEILITPPSPAKPPIMETVRSAETDAIKTADDVFVIGYSLPETDLDQQNLIRDAISARYTPISTLTIVNYNAPLDYFARITNLFQPQTKPRIFNNGFVAASAALA